MAGWVSGQMKGCTSFVINCLYLLNYWHILLSKGTSGIIDLRSDEAFVQYLQQNSNHWEPSQFQVWPEKLPNWSIWLSLGGTWDQKFK